MTNEEAREQEPCKNWYDVPSDEMTLEQARQAVKDLRKKLVEYLMPQSCEDAISREEALKAMCDKCPMYNCVTGCSSYRHIEKMPSVTPQPKKGKWNVFDAGRDYTTYSCSECGRLVTVYYDFGKPKDVKKEFPFCNCGAKMDADMEE